MAAGIVPVRDRTELVNASQQVPVFLTEDGREGIFEFDPSDLSALVTADPNQISYIPPDGNGRRGAWVRVGALAGDTTADLAVFQAACEAAAAAAASSASAASVDSDDADSSASVASASKATAVDAAANAADAEANAEAAAILAALAADAASNAVGDVSNASFNAPTRSALALLGTGLPAILTESGREGIFVFSSADLSAKVTLDPQQAIYIAPNSDATGASGAWVRRFSGAANVRWWGATGDGTTSDATAFTSALAYLRDTAQAGFGYTNGAGKLFIPKGVYNLGTTPLDVYGSLVIEGEGGSGAAGGTSVLKWTGACDGIRVQLANTSGATTVGSTGYPSAAGSVIRNLYLLGSFVSGDAEGEYHAIRLKATAVVQDVFIEKWAGDGIYSNCAAGAGSPLEGNINCSKIERVFIQRCRNGIFLKGADSNACVITGANCLANRAWGIRDESFLGNYYFGCHTSGNGWEGAGLGGTTATACTSAGNRYCVKTGQATGASTNAPSGTTADNTWWGYISAGTAFSGMPAWVSGTTFREGGAYSTTSTSAGTVFLGCYSESDQNPTQVEQGALLVSGFHAAGYRKNSGTGSPAVVSASAYKAIAADFDATGVLSSKGNVLANSGGLTATVALNPGVFAFNNGTVLYGMDLGYVRSNYCTRIVTPNAQFISFGGMGNNPTAHSDFTEWCSIDSTGISLPSGKALKLNSTTVIDSSRNGAFVGLTATSSMGYATGAGGAITQATSKSTAVTLNKSCGQITMNGAALANGSSASFTLTNSTIAATDTVIVNIASGASADAYNITVTAVATGSCRIQIINRSAGSLSEALVLNFAVLKAVAA